MGYAIGRAPYVTGDGAVVRLWTDTTEFSWHTPWDAVGKMQIEHNAAIRQQAAEIERLTAIILDKNGSLEQAATLLAIALKGKGTSEARNADLLKALERYGAHKEPCRELTAETAKMFYKPRCICGLDDAIKAAKG